VNDNLTTYLTNVDGTRPNNETETLDIPEEVIAKEENTEEENTEVEDPSAGDTLTPEAPETTEIPVEENDLEPEIPTPSEPVDSIEPSPVITEEEKPSTSLLQSFITALIELLKALFGKK
jgi:hypothetical protein